MTSWCKEENKISDGTKVQAQMPVIVSASRLTDNSHSEYVAHPDGVDGGVGGACITKEFDVRKMLMANFQEGKYINVLLSALKEFYAKDAESLFKYKMVDERAMVGCIYRYMWCRMVRKNMDCEIDIEYDRMRGSEGEACRKCIGGMPRNCDTKGCKLNCGNILFEWKDRKEDYEYNFRPDMIIHHRNKNAEGDNVLVVEVKKEGASDELCKFDKAKVSWCTCSNGCLQYRIGAFVVLHAKYATVEWRCLDGDWMQPLKVDENGIRG